MPTERRSEDPRLSTPEMATPPQRRSLRKLAPLPRIETDESSWRLGFIKDIEEHGIAKSVE